MYKDDAWYFSYQDPNSPFYTHESETDWPDNRIKQRVDEAVENAKNKNKGEENQK